MEIVARIQAHPSREHLHSRLAASLAPLPVEVMVHASDPPSPWAGYLACLRSMAGGDHSHGLVIQDDTQVVPGFVSALEQVAVSNPDTPVCLFLARSPRRTSTDATKALMAGQRYTNVYFRDFVPVVAVLWPKHKAEEFMVWAKDARLPGQPNPRSDDAVVGHWMRMTKQRIRVTVPSLVEHPGIEPSVKGVGNASTAFTALHLAEDALDYEW